MTFTSRRQILLGEPMRCLRQQRRRSGLHSVIKGCSCLAVAACVLANSNMQHQCIYRQAATCNKSMVTYQLPPAPRRGQPPPAETGSRSPSWHAAFETSRTKPTRCIYRRAVTTTLGSKKGLHAGAAASQRPRRACRLVSGRGRRQVGCASC